MGLLDWLTDGSLTGGANSGANPLVSATNNYNGPDPGYIPPVQAPDAAGGPTPAPMPNVPAPSTAPQSTAMPTVQPTPTPDPTPAAGPPDPPVPLPAPRPPGADAGPPQPTFAPNQTNTNPISPPAPGFNASPLAPGGGALSPEDAKGVVKSYEAVGGHAFAPPDGTSGTAAPGGAYKLGDQTALGRALGINPNSKAFNETLGGLGAGLTAAGNSKGKSPFQALASGAGATLEGGNKEAHAIEKDNIAYLNAAISAQRAGDTKGYQENMIEVQKGKLKLEQLQAANKDAAGNKNDSPTQLYLSAQRLVQPERNALNKQLQQMQKDGATPDQIAKAKADGEATINGALNNHYATLGIHPQTAAEIAKQPGMTPQNPIDASKVGITQDNIGKKLQKGQIYRNPAKPDDLYAYDPDKAKGTKSQSKPSSATPSVDKIKDDLRSDSQADALAKEDDD